MQPINSGGEHDTVHDGHDVLKRTVRLSAAAIISSNGLIWMRQNQRFLNGVSNSKLMSFSSHKVKMKALTALSLRHCPHVRRASILPTEVTGDPDHSAYLGVNIANIALFLDLARQKYHFSMTLMFKEYGTE